MASVTTLSSRLKGYDLTTENSLTLSRSRLDTLVAATVGAVVPLDDEAVLREAQETDARHRTSYLESRADTVGELLGAIRADRFADQRFAFNAADVFRTNVPAVATVIGLELRSGELSRGRPELTDSDSPVSATGLRPASPGSGVVAETYFYDMAHHYFTALGEVAASRDIMRVGHSAGEIRAAAASGPRIFAYAARRGSRSAAHDSPRPEEGSLRAPR